MLLFIFLNKGEILFIIGQLVRFLSLLSRFQQLFIQELSVVSFRRIFLLFLLKILSDKFVVQVWIECRLQDQGRSLNCCNSFLSWCLISLADVFVESF